MKCPKCGHDQAGTRECGECGILFAKFFALQRRREELARQRAQANDSIQGEPVEEELPSGVLKRFLKVYVWDTFKSPWNPVPKYGVITLTLFFAWLFYLLYKEPFYQLYPKTNIMDSTILSMFRRIDLVFHEGGHWIFGIFGIRTLTILGGSLNQLLVPFIVFVAFWQRRDASGTAFGLVWLFINFLEVAIYMADARHPVLPLIGNLDAFQSHDWRNLFNVWDLWTVDTAIAKTTFGLGWAGMILTSLWYLWTGLTNLPKDQDFQSPGQQNSIKPRKTPRPLEV